ncbi:MAG: plastocyanin [Actinomycetota bacterium]|jgi:plastocyanin|nr:plastocyanin [Actinomycetota bacterium]
MRRVAVAAALLCLALSGCSSDDPNTISMTAARRYDPATLTVQVGSTVTWTNKSNEAHSVTAYESKIPEGAEYFSSSGYDSEEEARDHIEKLLTAGKTYSVRFDVAGTYQYFCIPHEDQGMTGTIVVEDR